MKLLTILILLLAISGSALKAITYHAVVGSFESTTCGFSEGTGPVSGICNETTANSTALLEGRSDIGSLGIRATTSSFGNNPLGQAAPVRSLMTSQLSDVLRFSGIESGSLRLLVDIDGSSGASIQGGGTALSTTSIFVGSDLLYARTYVADFRGVFENDATGELGVASAVVPIIDGLANIEASMGINQRCFALTSSSSCIASSDFFSSADFIGASVLGEDGREVTNFSYSSDSGFDYFQSSVPPIAAVPVPAAFLNLLASILLLRWGRDISSWFQSPRAKV